MTNGDGARGGPSTKRAQFLVGRVADGRRRDDGMRRMDRSSSNVAGSRLAAAPALPPSGVHVENTAPAETGPPPRGVVQRPVSAEPRQGTTAMHRDTDLRHARQLPSLGA